MAPSDRYKANVDHLVIAGKTVIVLDTKVWTPSWYMSAFGKVWVLRPKSIVSEQSKRFDRFEPGEKRTVPMLVSMMRDYFGYNVIVNGTLVVWPSRENMQAHLSLYRPKEHVKVIDGNHSNRALRSIIPMQAADPIVLRQALQLLE
jgi:hypothetical protein